MWYRSMMTHPGVNGLKRGDDGYTRSVTVRAANGRTNRPIARLYSLEVSADECFSNVNKEESVQIRSTSDDETTHQKGYG